MVSGKLCLTEEVYPTHEKVERLALLEMIFTYMEVSLKLFLVS